MKTNILQIVLFVFCAAWFTACQKENTTIENNIVEKSVIGKLKQFYEKEKSRAIEQSTALKQQSDHIIPLWEQTQFYPDKQFYIIPLQINKASINNTLDISTYLVLTTQWQAYVYTVASKNDLQIDHLKYLATNIDISTPGDKIALIKTPFKEFYSGTITNNKTGYQLSIKKDAEVPPVKAGEGPVTENVPSVVCADGTINCTAYFWQTWVGGILISEVYMFTTCTCLLVPGEGGGSGGGSGNGGGGGGLSDSEICEANNTAVLNTVESTNFLTSSTLEESEALTRTRLYVWQFARAGIGHTLQGMAYDRGIHKRNNSNPNTLWEWQSLTNVSSATQGVFLGPTGTSLKLSVVTAEAVVGKYNATMFLVWHAETTATYKLVTSTRYEIKYSNITYNINSAQIPGF